MTDNNNSGSSGNDGKPSEEVSAVLTVFDALVSGMFKATQVALDVHPAGKIAKIGLSYQDLLIGHGLTAASQGEFNEKAAFVANASFIGGIIGGGISTGSAPVTAGASLLTAGAFTAAGSVLGAGLGSIIYDAYDNWDQIVEVGSDAWNHFELLGEQYAEIISSTAEQFNESATQNMHDFGVEVNRLIDLGFQELSDFANDASQAAGDFWDSIMTWANESHELDPEDLDPAWWDETGLSYEAVINDTLKPGALFDLIVGKAHTVTANAANGIEGIIGAGLHDEFGLITQALDLSNMSPDQLIVGDDGFTYVDGAGIPRIEFGEDNTTGAAYITTYDENGDFAFSLTQQADGTAILTQASGTTPLGEPITADSPFDYFLDTDGQLTGFEQTGASGEIFAGNVSYTEYNDFAIVTQGAVNPLTGLPSGIWDTQINTLDGTEPPAFDINDAVSLFNSAYGDDGNPDANYSFYENDALFSSIEALGYDPIAFDDFETVGWTTYGTGNSDLLSLNFELDGTDYSIFEDSETISFTTSPWVESDNWGTTFTPELGTTIDWVDSYANVQNRVSPLTFDLDGDGIESSHIYDQSVFFDIDGDGYAEKVGWIDADDGQLAFDANGDGIINDITELFGDDIMPAFEKLALFDTNKNGKIDQGDDDYANLLVWRDFDQDGFSDADELFALDDVSIQIKEISLAETPMDEFQNENYFSGKSTFTRFDNTVGDIVDVHFLNDNVNTWFQGAQSQVYGSTYEVSPEALLLPLSRGYGSLASLHIAMTDNTDLREIMTQLVNLDASDFDQFSSIMESFLYEWAGVTDNDPEARTTGNGSNIDARKVDFAEQFTGVEWQQMGVTSLVGSKASLGAKKIWGEIENMMTVRVLVQGTLSQDIFTNASYNFQTDTLTLGDNMADLIDRAQTYIANDPDQARAFWLSMGNILIMHADELGVTLAEISSALDAAYGEELFIGEYTLTAADGDVYSAIDGADEVLTTNVLVGDAGDNTLIGAATNDYIFGNGGADTLQGLAGDDFLRGDAGADDMDGGDGDDRLEGSGGDDTLIGGAGRDDLRGGDGVDTLIGGDGQDKLHGGAGADIIDGGSGADEIDYLESDQAVFVDLRTNTALGGHAEGDVFINIENITGSDFSDVLIGDAGDNLINGEAGNDIIYGGKGNDQLFGANGNDHLFGEEGDDTFDGFDGAEIFDGGSGTDTVNYSHPFVQEGVHADLSTGMGYAGASAGDQYISIEHLAGSQFGDVLIGDDNDNILNGRAGNDVLKGGGGDDILIGDTGVDQLTGGSGSDRFVITPHVVNTVIIHDFNVNEDILDYTTFTSNVTTSTEIDLQASGNDTIVSIDGVHRVLLKNVLPLELQFSHFDVDATNSTLAGVTTITGAVTGVAQQGDQFGNNLFGTLFADTIDGEDGDDEITGFAGNDTLNGGLGDDTLRGSGGADTLDGGDGFDTAHYGDSHQGVTVDLTTGTGSGGNAEGDTLVNIEALAGSVFDDVLIGNNENNVFLGFRGDDVIYAMGGQYNTLSGGEGNDTFVIDQVSGPALDETGLNILVDQNNGSFLYQGGLPTNITYITDFESDNSAEKIDLSGFTITDMYIAKLEGIQVNDEPFAGVVIQIFNGDENQTILLKDVDYASLSEDDFILPNSFSFDDAIWQVIGNNGNNLLTGSANDDEVFHLDGSDVVVGSAGNDKLIGLPGTPDYFVVAKDAGTVDEIYNFNSKFNTVHWYPLGEISSGDFGPNGENVVDVLTSGVIDVIDLTQFADIRSMSDLAINPVDTDGDSFFDATEITLTDGQSILLRYFLEGVENWTADSDNFNSPEYGIVGYGTIYYADTYYIIEDNFVFYDGVLNGTTGDDVLEGGSGVDEVFGGDGHDTLTGEGDDDVLVGGAGNDTLDGGTGNDILTGGDHADVYVIGLEAGAVDTITDFEFWRPDERIDLSAFDGQFADFAAFTNAISQQGGDAHIDLGNGQSLILENLDSTKLVAQNFIGNAGNNLAAVAQDDSISGDEDQTIIGNVLADNGNGIDSDPDGDALSVIPDTIETAQGGTVVLNADGSFVYTPVQDFNGTDSFSYTLTDGYGGIDTAFVTLTVNSVNDAPVGANDAGFATNEGEAVTIAAAALLANDSDVDGGALSLVSVQDAVNGSVALDEQGDVVFTAAAGYSGPASFTYTVEDGQGGSAVATVNLTVNAMPVLADDAGFVTDEDEAVTITAAALLANDSDLDGGVLSLVSVQDAVNGSVALDSQGDVVFTPAADHNGPASFTYTVEDGQGGSSTATVNLTANAVNDAPDGADDAGFSTDEDQAVTIAAAALLANDSDVDGDVLSLVSVQDAVNGSVALDEFGDVVFTPAADYSGPASFTYTVEDGQGGSTIATVNLTVNAVNDAPVGADDAGIATNEGVALTIAATALLANDSDVDGDVLTLVSVQDAVNGSVALDEQGDVVFTPDAGYTGPASFTYTVEDGQGGSAIATVNLTVNAMPVSADDAGFATDEDEAVTIAAAVLLANDSDADGGVLSLVSVQDAVNGSVALDEYGDVVFTPAADYTGPASFTYTVEDGQGGSATATVDLTVTAVNDAPVGVDDAGFGTDEDEAVTIAAATLLANDSDVDGDVLSLVSVQDAVNGSVAFNEFGDVVFTPAADTTGPASFTYTVEDGQGGSATATVNLTVSAVNDAPVGADDAGFATNEDQAVTIAAAALIANDSDVDGDVLSLVSVQDAVNGSVALDGEGDVVFTPAAGYTGPASFTYTVEDGQGGSAVATVNLTVNAMPVGADDTGFATDEDQAVTISAAALLANDSDVDGDVLSLVSVQDAVNGSVALDEFGDVVFTPAADYSGPASFTYTVEDGQGGSATATVNLTVNAVNDAPVGVDDAGFSTDKDQAVTIAAAALLVNDSDVDGGVLSLVSVQDAVNGSVALDENGDVVFTPAAGYDGPASFTYTVEDGQGGSATATVSLTIYDPNIAPVAEDDSLGLLANAVEGQPKLFLASRLLANDSDADGGTLSLVSVQDAVNGNVALDEYGNVVFTPDAAYTGPASFTYTVEDGQGGEATATVEVNVNPATFIYANGADNNLGAGNSNDVIFGYGGNDTLSGQGGDDVLYGGDGNDTLNGGTGFNTLYGGAGADTLNGNVDSDTLYGGDGDDMLNGEGSDDILYGGEGVDTLNGDFGLDTLYGGGGNDTLNGGHSGDTLYGGAGADTLNGDFGSDTLYGGDGNDTLNGGDASDTLYGGEGIDALDGGYGNDALYGDDGDDTLNGSYGQDALYGGEGVDILDGGSGYDTLYGGAGNDILTGGDHGDVYVIGLEAGAVDTITDFEFWQLNERIDLSAFDDQFADFAAFTNAISQQGSDAHIDLGNGQSLILENLDSTQLIAQNFIGNAGKNLASVAQDDSFAGDEDQTIIGNVLADNGNGIDSDPDGDAVSVVPDTIETAQGGTVVLNADGSFVYTPAQDFNGTDSFSYTLTDGYGGNDTALVTLIVNGVNDAPVGVDDAGFGTEVNQAVTIAAAALLANDSDVDGDVLSLVSVQDAVNGSVVLDGQGDVVFTPNAGYIGPASFTYTVEDSQGVSATATVDLTVSDPNIAPVAEDDYFGLNGITVEGQSKLFLASRLLANDSDADGGTLSVASVQDAVNGSVALDEYGNVVFTANAGYTGPASFTYTVADGQGGEDTATVDLSVNAATFIHGTAADNILGGGNPNDVIFGYGGNDTLDGQDGYDVLYGGDGNDTLNGGYGRDMLYGGDGVDTLNGDGGYDVLHGGDGNDTLNGGNSDDVLYGGAGVDTLNGGDGQDTLYGGAGNDTLNGAGGYWNTLYGGEGNDLLTGGGMGGNTFHISANFGLDTITDFDANSFGDVIEIDNVLYTDFASLLADAYQDGSDTVIEYDENNKITLQGVQLANLTENDFQFVDGLNDPPVGVDDTGFATDEDQAVTIAAAVLLANDDNVDGDVLSLVSVQDAVNGSVALDGQGDVVFTPAADYSGPASFTYTVEDGKGGSATATVDLTVTAVNDAPVGADDAGIATNEDQAVTIAAAVLLANDSDADGDVLSLVSVQDAVNGSVALDEQGDVVFTPDAEYTGPASFTYTVEDGQGGSAVATVNLTVNSVPVSADDAGFGTNEGEAVTIAAVALLANDSDADGDVLSLLSVQDAVNGSVALDGEGDVVFTPDAGYSGPASFTYTVEDGQGGSATATVNLTVNAIPVLADDAGFATDEDQAVTIAAAALLANDSDADGGVLSLVSVQDAVNGSVVLDGQGDVVFTPAADHNGPASFTYTVEDGQGGSATATVDLMVTAVNDAPVGVDDAGFGTEVNQAVTIAAAALLANDSDVDGDVLSLVSVQDAVNGSVVLDGQGDVVFTPNAGYIGPASFTYTVEDSQGVSATATVDLTVSDPNIAPVAEYDYFGLNGITLEGQSKLFLASRLLANDSDADGGTLSVASVQDAVNGSVALDEYGNVVFTANAGYTGPASFTYTVEDGQGGEDTATVDLSVNAATFIHGTAADNILGGGNPSDVIFGYGGNDTLDGGGGRDVLHGGDGDDTLNGGNGSDMLYGGEGIDTLNGDGGDDALYGGDGNDTLNGEGGQDALYGGDGNDTLSGGGQGDTLYGGEGIDTLNGGEGSDTLYGGDGNDTLNGEEGFQDTLYGGEGNDILTGGGWGANNFHFGANFGLDTITDFGANAFGDVIVFDSVLYADFDAVLADAYQDGGDTVIEYDENNKITLQGVQLTNLTQDEFQFA